MKKTISLFLALIMILSCFGFSVSAAPGAAVQITESGVQIEIAPFLYKSAEFTMEYPSHQSYSIKEKSNEGDYAISREINDLSYTFVFPAGTTEIECNVSLDETNWRGFSINDKENPNYWAKNAQGSIDYSQPLTFKRIEAVAEQDEYGVLYRDFLKDTSEEGFRDYDKIYWRLRYICDGESYTDYFAIKLYDYDNSEKFSLKTVNFNVAGLPFAALSGADVAAMQRASALYLSENSFDIVAIQEDFNYHNDLMSSLTGYSYMTQHTGNIPGGDGLNTFTKNMTIYNETRVPWNESCGILTDGSDALTPKGFVYTVIDAGNGIYIDFYNLHADAYGGAGSVAARTSQFRQLAEFIKARTKENNRPVIITGDFNYHLHSFEDNYSLYEIFLSELGFKDAWVESENNGDYFNFSQWYSTGVSAWGNWDAVERFLYKAGGGVDITVDDIRYVRVYDANGNSASDHAAAECDFTLIKTEDFEEKGNDLYVNNTSINTFFYRVM